MVKNIWQPLIFLLSLSCVNCGTTPEIKLERQKIELERQKLELEQQKLELEQLKQKKSENQLLNELETAKRRIDVLENAAQEREDDDGMCATLYNILEGCYKQGTGQTVEVCADLTLGLVEKLAPDFRNNPETLASFSLMCGKTCAYGSQGETFPSFSMFKREFCP